MVLRFFCFFCCLFLVAVQSVSTLDFYSGCSQPNCHSCTKETLENKICTGVAGISYNISCLPQEKQCAEVQIFVDPSCNNLQGTASFVCGSCYLSNANAAKQEYQKFECGEGTVTIYSGCNSSCGACQSSVTNQLQVCGKGVEANTYMALGGNRPCYSASIEFYNTADCTGPSVSLESVESSVCQSSSKVVCPGVPTAAPFTFPPIQTSGAPSTHANVTIEECSNARCAPATSCKIHEAPDKTCLPGSKNAAFAAIRYECSTETHQCVNMHVFQDNLCTNLGTLKSFVCDSCIAKDGGKGYYISCAADGSILMELDCGINCGTCVGRKVKLSPQTCVALPEAGMNVVVDTIPQPCYGIWETSYSNATCSEDSVILREMKGQGACSSAHRVTCPNWVPQPTVTPPPTNPPNSFPNSNITVHHYACADPFCSVDCKELALPDAQCTTVALHNASSGNMTTINAVMSCHAGTQQCASLQFYNDQNCSDNLHAVVPKCGSCHYQVGFGYYSVDCNTTSGAVLIHFDCSDRLCNNCSKTQVSDVAEKKCTKAALQSSASIYLYNLGLFDCTTVTFEGYAEYSGCVGVYAHYGTHAQNACNEGYKLDCGYGTLAPQTSVPTTTGPTEEPTSSQASTLSPTSSTSPTPTSTTAVPSGGPTSTPTAPPPSVTSTPGPSNSIPPTTLHPEPTVTPGPPPNQPKKKPVSTGVVIVICLAAGVGIMISSWVLIRIYRKRSDESEEIPLSSEAKSGYSGNLNVDLKN